MTHPYESLPRKAFWRSAVANLSPFDLRDIYAPRFAITRETRIAAAGSCFAQHIGRKFKERDYDFIDLEPAPPMLNKATREKFGFDLYSARYGNVYSARQLLQLFHRASGAFSPQETVWEKDSRFRDPFRPSIEPDGFASIEELERDRAFHLGTVDSLLEKADLFVFTFGLTEAWECIADGAILPTCPGTIAGRYDEAKYRFHNFSYDEVLADAEAFIALALERNPDMRFLFTVSPVPLTATASGGHVLPATVYSKSVLRAVCGALYERYPQVDYFPSFELVSAHPMRAMFFRPNLRTVATAGVDFVMNTFFQAHGDTASLPSEPGKAGGPAMRQAGGREAEDDDVVCDEEILEVFGR